MGRRYSEYSTRKLKTMEKRILIVILSIAALFMLIIGPIGFIKAYKYYYGLPSVTPEGKIIFASNRLTEKGYGMHLLENDGIKLTPGALRPRFVRSTGETISWGGIGDNALYVTDKNFLNMRRLDFTDKLKMSNFDVSPDGKKLCFTSSLKMNNSELKQNPENLFVVNIDGADLRQLTNLYIQYLRTANYPRWSPNGHKILFVYPERNDVKNSPALSLFIVDLDTGHMKDVLSKSKFVGKDRIDPCWSPDAAKIAFISYENAKGIYNIYLMNADGTDITRITNSPYDKRQPVFSPNGKQILYVGYPKGISAGGELFLVDIETRKEYRVTKPKKTKNRRSWSDDMNPDWHE